MMGLPDTPSDDAPHLYPQAIQLQLYQAFIFSIPILFSIILFLLFYLFYLKRRDSTILYLHPILPTSSNQATPFIHSNFDHFSCKGEIKDKLPTILFDEELRKRDSQCCVCLGEFEIKEELLQVPSCKHVFHVECLHHWLHSNTTCPLCRSSIVPVTKLYHLTTDSVTGTSQDSGARSNHNQQNTSSEQQLDDGSSSVSDIICTEQLTIDIEASPDASGTCVSSSGRLPEMSNCTGNEGSSDQESSTAQIQIPNT